MNASGDAAESIVRMSLQGLEVATRISGSGAKNIAALIYTIMKDNTQTKGKTRLTNMIKSGKELKVFTVKEENFKKFTQEAKRYGVLFCALKGKEKSIDGMVDIMVRAEDASKINRIVERFKFVTIDTASIKNDVQKSKDGKDKGIIVKSIEEKLVDDILTKPINKEEQEVSNPQVAKMEKSPLSEPTSKNKNKSDQGAKLEKPSVREEIKQIKEEQKQKADNNLDKSELSKEKDSKNKFNETKHKQPKNKKKKSKERG